MTQRTEVMMGFFYLAAFYAALRYWESTTNNARTAWLAAATVAGVLGMISKEMMASAIAMVLLYERTFITGSFLKSLRASWPLYVGLALGWLPIFVINANGPRTPLAGFHLGIPAHVWWYTQTEVFALFLKLTFWPWPLVIHYEIPYLETLRAAWPWVLIVVAYCLAAVLLVWRRTSAGFVATCLVAVLSPTLLIPLPGETMAERRMYVPLAALVPFFIAGAYALLQGIDRKRERGPEHREWAFLATAAGVVVVAGIFGLVSFRRLAAYRNESSIWEDAAQHQPNDPLIQINLGTSLAHNGLHREAIVYFEQALKLDPKHSHAHYNMARALVETGRPAEALPYYEEAVRADPGFADAHYNYALALRNAGRIAAAIEHFEAAIQCRPDFAAAHNNLAATLASVERYADAVPHFEQAVELEPDAQTYFNLAMTVVELGRVSEAIGYLEKAVKLTPSLEGYINLAAFYAAAERRAEAIAASQKAIALARKTGQKDLAAELEARLATYRARTGDK
jgi:tetratricopeptide (TPR) repeat protein